MPPLNRIAAFIFDMDGLVLDTEPAYHAAWYNAVALMDLRISHNMIQELSGLSYRDVLAKLKSWCGDGFNVETFSQLSAQLWREHVEVNGIKVNKGVPELLEFARRNAIPVALATNSHAVYAEKCLRIAGLDGAFPVMVTANDVSALKPAPEIFQRTAQVLKVNIASCIVFEDSYPGIMAASSAGACAVYVPSVLPANPAALALCDLRLDDLSQFLAHLTSVGKPAI